MACTETFLLPSAGLLWRMIVGRRSELRLSRDAEGRVEIGNRSRLVLVCDRRRFRRSPPRVSFFGLDPALHPLAAPSYFR
jgi:hypothetical protein